MWERFDVTVRGAEFHPFVAANYDVVVRALEAHRAPGRSFLEWGSAMGVITIAADLLGYDASGIELDAGLVDTARELAAKYGSRACFATGSFIPSGYRFTAPDGDRRMGTVGSGASGYQQLGRALDDFDVVYAYPWDGEAPMMLDLMRTWGGPESVLLLHDFEETVTAYRSGRAPIATYGPNTPGGKPQG